MKKILLFLFTLLLITGCKKIDFESEEKELFLPLLYANKDQFEYGMNYKLVDIFNNKKMVFTEEYLDVSSLGTNVMEIEYSINGKQYSEKFVYNVVDTTKPLIYNSNVYTMYLNDEDDLVNRIICADIQDPQPNCFIEGEYDLTKTATYPLKYVAIDSQGNKEEADFTLIVKETKPSKKAGSVNSGTTPVEKIIEEYKTKDTKIGIDVSKYQGDINWQDVKNAGIEFAMIRIGFGYNDVNKMDEKYLQNIKGALDNGIEVGIYFYSYATTIEEIELQASFVLENIQNYNVTFPIAFDWENYTGWNEYGISLYDLRHMSEVFLARMKKEGYQALQYGSKNYLTYFWEPIKDDIWLAYYIKEGQTQNYHNPIKMWQICNNGRVPGIDGDVDIDIYCK